MVTSKTERRVPMPPRKLSNTCKNLPDAPIPTRLKTVSHNNRVVAVVMYLKGEIVAIRLAHVGVSDVEVLSVVCLVPVLCALPHLR